MSEIRTLKLSRCLCKEWPNYARCCSVLEQTVFSFAI